jgi:HD superfamily phosphohydrolase
MYWQVYLHKTVIAGEQLLVKILERAKQLTSRGKVLFATPALQHFLQKDVSDANFFQEEIHLAQFARLDDQDIYASIKVWTDSDDVILSRLCRMLSARKLYKVEISNDPPDPERVEQLRSGIAQRLEISKDDLKYFVFTDTITNRAYNAESSNINILLKNDSLLDIAKASDLSNLESLDKTVKKHILCYVRDI